MNIANKITVLRLILVPVFVICYYVLPETSAWPVIIFIVAALTDALDGHLARSRHLITDFGKFLDPVADKILTISAFILLTERGRIPAWMVIIIISRELAITGFRIIAASNGVTIAASKWGKVKTATQMATLVFLLLERTQIWPEAIAGGMVVFANILLVLAVFFTIVSGVDYLVKNKQVLNLDNI